MEKSEIEEHRQILPRGLSVFISFAEGGKNSFLNRNYLENNATADFFRLRVIPPSAQHVILTHTVRPVSSGVLSPQPLLLQQNHLPL